ncbi:MAG TPA: hypothetical protein VFP58_09650 [Candidatus Eisenbacteria bacterium]|nr:hypothetical protein [Candidatus Eisenbacteria bacterium]
MRAALHAATFAIALLAPGCASTHSVSRDLSVTNETDRFRIRIASLERFTEMLEYEWNTTSSIAMVVQAGGIQDGVAHIEIRDPEGLVIHSKSLREAGTFVTHPGRPGVWKVRFDLDQATGSMDVSLQKPG